MKFLALALVFFSVHAQANFNVGDELLLQTLVELRDDEGAPLFHEVQIESFDKLLGNRDYYTIRLKATDQVIGVFVDSYNSMGGTDDLFLELADESLGRAVRFVSGKSCTTWKGPENSRASKFCTGQNTFLIPQAPKNEDGIYEKPFSLSQGVIEKVYQDEPADEEKYSNPELTFLRVRVDGQPTMSTVANVLVDIFLADQMDCLFALRTQVAMEDLGPEGYKVCVGARTTKGTVTKLLRGPAGGYYSSTDLFIELEQNGKKLVYHVNHGLPFGVFP